MKIFAICCFLVQIASGQSLADLRHTPEGQIIRQVLRMPPDETHLAALQAAAASRYGWSHEALELAIRSGPPAVVADPDSAMYHLLVGPLLSYLSLENCRYYTPLLTRMAKQDPKYNFGVTKLLGRANTPQSAAALAVLVDDDVTQPGSLANLALSVLVDDISEGIGRPVIENLLTTRRSAARQMIANVWTNRLLTSPPLPPPAVQARHQARDNLQKMLSAEALPNSLIWVSVL